MSMFSIFRRHLKTAYIGLEITDTHMKLAEVQVSANRRPIVTKLIMEPLAPGTVEEGRIKYAAPLILALKTILKLNDFSTKRVHFVVPSQTIMVRQLKLPDLPDKPLRKVLEFEVKHNIHLPFETPYFDFINLSGSKIQSSAVSLDKKRKFGKASKEPEWYKNEAAASKEEGTDPFGAASRQLFADFEQKEDPSEPEAPQADVLMVAAPGELVTEYATILKECGLKPISAEVKAFSLLRLVESAGVMNQEETYLAVDINHEVSDVSIFHKGQLKLTRSVPINLAIHKPTATPEEEAFSNFLNPDAEFHNACGDLAHEMERLMNFYRYTLNNRDQEFHSFVLTGDIVRLEEVAAYLEDRLNQKAVFTRTALIESAVPDFEQHLPRMAIPVGLGLRGNTP